MVLAVGLAFLPKNQICSPFLIVPSQLNNKNYANVVNIPIIVIPRGKGVGWGGGGGGGCWLGWIIWHFIQVFFYIQNRSNPPGQHVWSKISYTYSSLSM